MLDLPHIDVRSASKCKFQRPRCNMGFRCASRWLQPSSSSLDRSVDLAKAQIATFLEGLYKEIMTRSSSWVDLGFRYPGTTDTLASKELTKLRGRGLSFLFLLPFLFLVLDEAS